jgi:UDP-N-acetyl-D-galactosamine dehydrogenase
MLTRQGNAVKGARVGILGLTFKENVPDLRNSRVPDIVAELREFNVDVIVHDPLADAEHALHEVAIELSGLESFESLDGLVLAVPHQAYQDIPAAQFIRMLKPSGAIVDVKSLLQPAMVPPTIAYWAL